MNRVHLGDSSDPAKHRPGDPVPSISVGLLILQQCHAVVLTEPFSYQIRGPVLGQPLRYRQPGRGVGHPQLIEQSRWREPLEDTEVDVPCRITLAQLVRLLPLGDLEDLPCHLAMWIKSQAED